MSFLGLSGPIHQPLAEAGSMMGFELGIASEPDFVSPWWAGAHGLVMAFQCGIEELGVTGHVEFQDPRISAYERDLQENYVPESSVSAIDGDGRLLQQVSATGVSLAGLEIARPIEGRDIGSVSLSAAGCTVLSSCTTAALVGVQTSSCLHCHTHPLPLRVTFEDDALCRDNLRRRGVSLLWSRFQRSLQDDHPQRVPPRPCTAHPCSFSPGPAKEACLRALVPKPHPDLLRTRPSTPILTMLPVAACAGVAQHGTCPLP